MASLFIDAEDARGGKANVAFEVGDQLFIRRRDDTDRGELFRLETGTQSTYKWGSILQAWQRSSRPVT